MRRPKRYIAVAVAAALALAVCLFALTRRAPAVTLRAGYAEFLPYISIDESGNPAGLAVQSGIAGVAWGRMAACAAVGYRRCPVQTRQLAD